MSSSINNSLTLGNLVKKITFFFSKLIQYKFRLHIINLRLKLLAIK